MSGDVTLMIVAVLSSTLRLSTPIILGALAAPLQRYLKKKQERSAEVV